MRHLLELKYPREYVLEHLDKHVKVLNIKSTTLKTMWDTPILIIMRRFPLGPNTSTTTFIFFRYHIYDKYTNPHGNITQKKH